MARSTGGVHEIDLRAGATGASCSYRERFVQQVRLRARNGDDPDRDALGFEVLDEPDERDLAKGEQAVGSEGTASGDGQDDMPGQFRCAPGSVAVPGYPLGELGASLPVQDQG
jgi:hypothetical protein